MDSVKQPSLEEVCGNVIDEVKIINPQHQDDLPESFQQGYKSRPRRMSTLRRERLEELVAVGQTLNEMKSHFAVTRERVRQMLHSSGLHQAWKERRKEVKSRKRLFEAKLQTERQSFADTLRQLEEIVALESPWAEVKVWQYRNIHPINNRNSLPTESLLKLFETYAVARLEGKKLSVCELGKISGMSFNVVARILREVGLDRMYRNIENRHYFPKWKKKVAERVFVSSPLSVNDIAYFIKIPSYVVRQELHRRRHKSVKKEPILSGSGGGKAKPLTYCLASQIYEAHDLGFNPEETGKLLDLSLNRVTFAQYRRNRFAPVIIRVLSIMYPEEGINTPYRWKKYREMR